MKTVSAVMAGCLFCGAMAGMTGAARAQSASAGPASALTITANVGLASDYRFRGISQTDKNPAVQGGFDLTHTSGLYAGVWASNISWISDGNSAVSAPIEMDFYGGYRGEIVKGLTFDVGGLQYYYPGSYPSNQYFPRPHTFELYAQLGYGPFTLKYSNSLTRLFGLVNPVTGASTTNSGYLDLTGNFDLGWWGLSATGHVGHQFVHNYSQASYTDWKIALNKDLGKGFSASLAYIDTNAKKSVYSAANNGRFLGGATVVASITRTF
ncbi:MAG: hypothetical protein EPN80_18830 [Pandoraea sp.]|nr:MAG: hypothetical protein EPN80_18830 [Pandoraea sp.]TAM14430.1 MAG: hypothetical protein EPN65_20935 [Pandoraea sp.]